MTDTALAVPTAVRRALKFARALAVLLALVTFFLVIAGGQVTSTDSGDAVPTWPLPLRLPMEGGVFFELGHRQVAVASGSLTVVLFGTLLCLRRWISLGVVRGALAAVVLVLLQAGLGGVRVLVGTSEGTAESPLVAAIGIGHALLGHTFFWMTAALAYFLLRPTPTPASSDVAGDGAADDPSWRAMTRVTWFTCGALYLQLFLGALVRLVRPGPRPVLLFLHIGGALLVILVLIELIFRTYRDKERFAHLKPIVRVAKSLLGVQIILGFVAYFAVNNMPSPASAEITWRTVMPTLHAGVGALLLAAAVVALLVHRTRGDATSSSAARELR